ncbi:hypothetical protein G9A89_017268 [Geosiphon pyriformis]|nr:hypothetical protein G9A89_017268 [Geosiphon pyriformis]
MSGKPTQKERDDNRSDSKNKEAPRYNPNTEEKKVSQPAVKGTPNPRADSFNPESPRHLARHFVDYLQSARIDKKCNNVNSKYLNKFTEKAQKSRPNGLKPLPEAPGKIPLFGEFVEWGNVCGDIYLVQFGPLRWIVLNSSKAVDDLLVKRGAIYSSRKELLITQILSKGRNLGTSPYNDWYKKVMPLAHNFLTPRKIDSYSSLIVQGTHDLLTKLLEVGGTSNGINPKKYLQFTSFNIILNVIFGIRLKDFDDPIYQEVSLKVNESMDLLSTKTMLPQIFPWLFNFGPYRKIIPRATQLREDWSKIMKKLFEKVEEDPEKKPCVARDLMEKHKEGYIDELDVVYLAYIFIIAGTETLATSIDWLCAILANHPEFQERAHEELDRIVGHSRLPNSSDFQSLPFIQALIKETLRWSPPLPMTIPRYLEQDDEYMGYHLPKNSGIVYNIYALNSDPKRYKDPEVFNPDRFFGIKESMTELARGSYQDRDQFAFGLGRRLCTGISLAESEFLFILTGVLWAFRIENVECDVNGKPLQIDLKNFELVSMQHPNPYHIKFIPRHEGYDKSKPFFDFEITVGPSIAIIKKIAKKSGASAGFKPVLSRKKKKSVSLEKSVGRGSVPTKTGDTTESENIDMEEECLVEKTNFDYDENRNIADENYDQMLKGPGVKTKKTLGKPLEKIDFLGQDKNDDALLDVPLVFPPPLKNLKKLAVVRKLFSKVNGFGRASTPSKFSEIICASFTFEATRAADILINTNLKKSTGHSDRTVVVKEIPVGTSAEAMAMAEGCDFIGSVGRKTCVIDQHPVTYAQTRCAVVCFDSAVLINAVIRTTPVLKGANLHWFYINFAKYAKYGNLGHIFLSCFVSEKTSLGKPTCKILSDDDKSRLASIYARCSVPIFHSVSFGGAFWANIVDGSSFPPLPACNGSASSDFSSEMKPTLMMFMELNNRFAGLKHSLISLIKHIDKLAKRLDSLGPTVFQPKSRANIVISESLDVVTGSETIVKVAVFGFLVISKMEKTLNNFLIMVMGLSAKINNADLVPAKDVVYWHVDSGNMVSIIMETKLRSNVRPWIMNKFDGVKIFSSGLDKGFLGAGVAIIMNNSLARYVSKIKEVPGYLVLVQFLFKSKLSVVILGLYTDASAETRFGQACKINFIIAKAVNSSTFMVLGSDFNENSENLSSALAGHEVASVSDFFDTNHNAVLVSVGLGGLLDVRLNDECK